jgi:outer membrane protein assembly factor BamE (lipoprotein component of BamABCDE complex)
MKNISFSFFKILILVLLGGFIFSACTKGGNSKLTATNLDQVAVGMKKTEVKAILGEPNRVETGQFTLLEKTTYYYESRGAKVTITFLNDAVVSKDGSFN